MPIYEYDCGKCGRRTEALQRMNEAPLRTCPHCGGRLKKAISAPAIQFRGTGWYVTDYATSRSEKPEKSDKAETRAGEAEKGEKGEKAAKPEKTEKPKEKKKPKADR
ncbi:MAG TPA: FmdB family zinc ribbon protein [Thermoanaerobaculia bacterium]